MKKILLISLMILPILSAAVFGEVVQAEKGKPRVVIFYQNTEWKQELLRQLTSALSDARIDVKTDLLDNCPSYSTDDWDAVVLMSNVKAFNPLPVAEEFIKRNKYSSKIVYLSTYVLFNNPYGFLGLSLDKARIDAITSASPDKKRPDPNDIEKASVLIQARVLKILSGTKP